MYLPRSWALLTKIRRDLRRRGRQSTAIAVMVLLGVLLFIASYDSFRNLSVSYERTYERLHFADLTATAVNADNVAEAIRGENGVARVTTRTQADVPMIVDTTKLVGRVIGLPSAPEVNDISLTAGALPEPGKRDQVVVEHHTADAFGLDLGDRLWVFDSSAWHAVTVSGIARSPEYLWPARSRQDVLGDPNSFAVFFAPQPRTSYLTGQSGSNQVVIEMTSTATRSDRDALVGRLRSAGADDVMTQAEQPSNASLHGNLTGFSKIAVGFPLLFLVAAGITEYVLITRLVCAERPIIGALLAMGARRGVLVRHYVAYGAIVSALGAVAGVVLGAVVTSAVTSAYTSAIGIPDTVVSHRISTAAVGFALGLLTGSLTALAPALAAARTAPAQAMRGDHHPGRPARWAARWVRLPTTMRMALRSLARNRRRTLSTMTGTVLAMVLILTSVGVFTSMHTMVDVQYDQVQREDATVQTDPKSGDISGQLQAVPGVSAIEAGRIASVTVQADGKSYSTSLTGLPPNTTMHGFRTTSGESGLPLDAVVAGQALSGLLNVRVGDLLTVTSSTFGSPHRVRLAALVDEPMGTQLYATEDAVRAIAPASLPGYLLRFEDGADRAAVRAAATAIPGVVTYTDIHSLKHQANRFLAVYWIFTAVMLALGAALAFTVIYVTMTANMAERTTELAALRAAGVSVQRLTTALMVENLTATILAVPIGLATGTVSAYLFLHTLSSDRLAFAPTFGALPTVSAVAAVLAAAALSQLPALRFVRRMDVARVMRERAL
ncbi:ABC transporter permease [Nocardia mexicana]|uniref:Putative ABC transport system permease protein n=1 Tax=Nocardia mexicana TaxID=279262 RepID=A0A370GF95_9NOCA|nr:FtsX-like permease family protein [Nocardia mexicana]RDI41779.1 putative ABC transport system permease protein [Nocardia mexicana]